jgi:Putative beta barrel porin-7 (BBP7)
MRKGFLGSLGAMLAGAGLALAQPAPVFRPANGYSFTPAPAVAPQPTAAAAPGYPATGYPAAGYPTAGYPAAGYPAAGYPAAGYPAAGYPAAGYPAAGYPARYAPSWPYQGYTPSWPYQGYVQPAWWYAQNGYQRPAMGYPGYPPRAPQPNVRQGLYPVMAQRLPQPPQQLPPPAAPTTPPVPPPGKLPEQPEPVPPPKRSVESIPIPSMPEQGRPLVADPYSPSCGTAGGIAPDEGPVADCNCPSGNSGKKSKSFKELWKGKDEKRDDGCPHECCFWFGADYLFWFFQKGPLATPLVTSGPAGTQAALGGPGTNVLFGGNGLHFQGLNGLRTTAGYWITPFVGVEASGFAFEQGGDTFRSSDGGTVLARPFVNAQTGLESSALVASPGALSGSVAVNGTMQLWGAEANMLLAAYRGCRFGLNLLSGFRYLSLDEDLDMLQSSTLQAGGTSGFGGTTLVAPNRVAITDTFDTRNQFVGGQVGLQSGYQFGRMFVGVNAKVAVGVTHQSVDILGNTQLLDTGALFPGGLLAQPSNFGRRTNDALTIIPEGNLECGVQLSDRITATLGYTFLYWTRVARPGDQIERLVNPSQVPTSLTFAPGFGPASPGRIMTDRGFWAQGINAGLAIRY